MEWEQNWWNLKRRQGIAAAIKPQIIPTIIMELCDDKNVIKVTVEGDEKPYPAYGKYYMRTADGDRESL